MLRGLLEAVFSEGKTVEEVVKYYFLGGWVQWFQSSKKLTSFNSFLRWK